MAAEKGWIHGSADVKWGWVQRLDVTKVKKRQLEGGSLKNARKREVNVEGNGAWSAAMKSMPRVTLDFLASGPGKNSDKKLKSDNEPHGKDIAKLVNPTGEDARWASRSPDATPLVDDLDMRETLTIAHWRRKKPRLVGMPKAPPTQSRAAVLAAHSSAPAQPTASGSRRPAAPPQPVASSSRLVPSSKAPAQPTVSPSSCVPRPQPVASGSPPPTRTLRSVRSSNTTSSPTAPPPQSPRKRRTSAMEAEDDELDGGGWDSGMSKRAKLGKGGGKAPSPRKSRANKKGD
ncbi:hypothetical protein B0H17DRAFT_1138445 [Mycena rosella]|uniref:Uncharacterized protein n=1 Tax=Mycena rosella TaxID=1033263 RepID=A0AAD7D7T8_MYCRO|nr:hypothetical protein B0H17DRAFT_1138445 [Mycena rosella]